MSHPVTHHEQPIEALEKASESPEYAVPASLLLASAHFGSGNFEATVKAADRVLAKDGDRIRRFRESVDIAIYTPGSNSGLPLSILRSFAPPAAGADPVRGGTTRHGACRARAGP